MSGVRLRGVWLAGLVVGVVLGLAVVGCGESDDGGSGGGGSVGTSAGGSTASEEQAVRKVFEGFVAAAQAGDGARICRALSSSMIEEVEARSTRSCAGVLGLLTRDADRDMAVKAKRVRVDGATATIRVSESGPTGDYVLPVVKEGGEWKLDSISGRAVRPPDAKPNDG